MCDLELLHPGCDTRARQCAPVSDVPLCMGGRGRVCARCGDTRAEMCARYRYTSVGDTGAAHLSHTGGTSAHREGCTSPRERGPRQVRDTGARHVNAMRSLGHVPAQVGKNMGVRVYT